MAESAHRTHAPGEVAAYPRPELDDWQDRVGALSPAPAEGAGAVVARLRRQVEELGAAHALGPFEAEEEATGECLLLLLQFAAARGFNLRGAAGRALWERRIVAGMGIVVDVPG